jgi:hypothetical protein
LAQVLKSLGKECVDIAYTQVDRVANNVNSSIKEARSKTESVFGRRFDKPAPPEGPLAWIAKLLLNNPILDFLLNFNPATFIITRIAEYINVEVTVPDFIQIAATVQSAIIAQIDRMMGRIMQVAQQLGQDAISFITNPSLEQLASLPKNLLGALAELMLDFISDLVSTVFGTVKELLGQSWALLTQEWHIPFVTELWAKFAEQPLTVVNYCTYLLAGIMNLCSTLSSGRLPFEDAQLRPLKATIGRILQEESSSGTTPSTPPSVCVNPTNITT